ncbi:helix-turn-helix transcriptional regulator [Pseudomonas sp. UL073]|uniref:Helix-turn-helix transcriptional regulator n=1 Tax=Zestomonas insulae TaxID=2809017 RepID=A0ABS2IIX6_9GAMM|nr:TetR/AcrR family transcriptional regulator [Pseudomonas insulae]MBM7063016.1 helix-turn-helix transcriptional regulator [Pseudomonas insulae]
MSKPPIDELQPGADGVLRVEVPAQQRKAPRQARSIALVEALKQTARQILERYGRDELTTLRLAEESGVATSSIYEYFPTIEALIAAIYEDYRREVRSELLTRIAALPAETTLYDGIVMTIEVGLGLYQQKMRFDPEFSVRSTHYDELVRLDVIKAREELSGSATQALMSRFADEVVVRDKDKAHFLVFHTLLALSRSILLERPAYLGEKDTVQMLARMVHGVLTSAQ